ncbi:MAG TPA: Mur ligase domain-containing protein, partial [Myxococcota bacterium]|nr:Mur ligase domain-containing protein [Myxococcota bacterium]
MRLSDLLEALPPGLAPIEILRADGRDDPPIRGIQIDSRAVAPGDLFVALRGSLADGHHFLGAAAKLGATAFLVEALPDGVDLQGRPTVVVRDTRRALAPLATRFYGDPSAELTLVGVTGTNGKTSTSYLVESILQKA